VTLAPRLARNEDATARETILTLDLGARHQPVRGLRVDVSDPVFFRGVIVEARVDPPPSREGAPGVPLTWRYLGECAIYRYEEGGTIREGLRVDVIARERVLRLRLPPPPSHLAPTAGDPALYAARAQPAVLSGAQALPAAPPPPPPWTERNPVLLWAGLIAVVGALGAVTWRALRTAD
jgi:hypothetical protein